MRETQIADRVVTELFAQMSNFVREERFPANRWLEYGTSDGLTQLYVRRALRPDYAIWASIEGTPYPDTLDLATFSVPIKLQYKGIAGRLIRLSTTLPVNQVYVENVLEPGFANWIGRHNFVPVKNSDPVCFYHRCS